MKSNYFVCYRLGFDKDGTKLNLPKLGGTIFPIELIIQNPYRHIMDSFIQEFGSGNHILLIACVDKLNRNQIKALKEATMRCYYS
jgi:hypothetical protein